MDPNAHSHSPDIIEVDGFKSKTNKSKLNFHGRPTWNELNLFCSSKFLILVELLNPNRNGNKA